MKFKLKFEINCFSFPDLRLSALYSTSGFMSMSNGNIVDLGSLEALSFDAFGRNPERDIVCVAPILSGEAT